MKVSELIEMLKTYDQNISVAIARKREIEETERGLSPFYYSSITVEAHNPIANDYVKLALIPAERK